MTLEFSATIIKQHPITHEDVSILVKEAMELMEREKNIMKNGGDPMSELAKEALFRSLTSAELSEQNGNINFSSNSAKETVKDSAVEKYQEKQNGDNN